MATGYELEWGLVSGGGTTVVDLSVPEYSLTGLSGSTAYKARVRGYDGVTYSDWSDWVEVTTTTTVTISGTVGSVVVSANSVAVYAATLISTGVGVITATGKNATVVLTTGILCTTGAIQVSGKDCTLSVGLIFSDSRIVNVAPDLRNYLISFEDRIVLV